MEAIAAAVNATGRVVCRAEAWMPREDSALAPSDVLVWPRDPRGWNESRVTRLARPHDVLSARRRAQAGEAIGMGLPGAAVSSSGSGAKCFVRRSTLQSRFEDACGRMAPETAPLDATKQQWMEITLPRTVTDLFVMLPANNNDDKTNGGGTASSPSLLSTSPESTDSLRRWMADGIGNVSERCVDRADLLMTIQRALFLDAFPAAAAVAMDDPEALATDEEHDHEGETEEDHEAAVEGDRSSLPEVAAVLPIWDVDSGTPRVAAVLLFFSSSLNRISFVRFLEAFYHVPTLVLPPHPERAVCSGCGVERLSAQVCLRPQETEAEEDYKNDIDCGGGGGVLASSPGNNRAVLVALFRVTRALAYPARALDVAPCACGCTALAAMEALWMGE